TDDLGSWAEILRHAGATIVNGGLSGDTTTGARVRLTQLLESEPDLAIVLLGTNDARRHGGAQLLSHAGAAAHRPPRPRETHPAPDRGPGQAGAAPLVASRRCRREGRPSTRAGSRLHRLVAGVEAGVPIRRRTSSEPGGAAIHRARGLITVRDVSGRHAT